MTRPATCPECERSNGPHYRGPCDHDGPRPVRAILTAQARRARQLRADCGRAEAIRRADAALDAWARATRARFVLQATDAPGQWFDVEACHSLKSAQAIGARARAVWRGDVFRIVFRLEAR
jgi:hypothetical protein